MKKVMMMIGMLMVATWAFGQEINPAEELYKTLAANKDVQGMQQFVAEEASEMQFWGMYWLIHQIPKQDRVAKIQEFAQIRTFTTWENALINLPAALTGQEQNKWLRIIAANGHDINWGRMLVKHLMSTKELIEHYTNVLKNTPLNEKTKDYLSEVKGEILKLKDL